MKLFYAFLLSFSLVFAKSASSSSTEYESALELFKTRQYQQAMDAFEALIEKDLSSLEYNFYYARAAFVLKRYHLAIAAYERILIFDPYNNRTKLELGRTYFVMGKYDLSKQYFNEVLASHPPKAVQESVAFYIEKIKNRDNISSWTGMFQAGLMYDSNINSASNKDTFFVPLLNVHFTNTSLDEEDWAHHELFVLNHLLDTSKMWGFAIKNSLTFYNKGFEEYGAFDIRFFNYTPSLAWKFDKLLLDIGLTRDVMWYGGDPLLDNFGYFTKFTYKTSPSKSLSALLKVFEKSYQKLSDKSKGASVESLFLAYQSQLNPHWAWYFKENLQRERKIAGNDPVVNYDSFETILGLNYMSSSKTRWNYEISHRNMSYKDKDPFFLKQRIDDRLTIKVGVTKPVTKSVSLQTVITGLQNDSTTATTNYERATVMFNVLKSF